MQPGPDIDEARITYLGVSQGTAYGVIFTALEERFKAVVFLDGGFFLAPTWPPRDQVNFAPRLKKPVLMINGRYDFTFSPDRAQEPMFRMIGTRAPDKRRVVFDTPPATPHDSLIRLNLSDRHFNTGRPQWIYRCSQKIACPYNSLPTTRRHGSTYKVKS